MIKNNHSKSYLNWACAVALKIAKILAAQASAQPFKNNIISAKALSQLASKIIAAQVPTSVYGLTRDIAYF